MKGYKGFNKDMTCRDMQYKEGESVECTGDLSLCENGLHFCENPLDCLNYYNAINSVYHEIEAEGVSEETHEDSKRVCRKISVGARLSIKGLVEATIGFIFSKAEVSRAHSATSGDYANSATSGDGAHSATSGNYAHSATSGNGAHSATSGDYAHSATSGDGAHSATSGYGANSACLGYDGEAIGNGPENIAIAVGRDGRAKASLGSWIVLAERDQDWKINGVRCVQVDGEAIKADTFYKLVNGEFEEAES